MRWRALARRGGAHRWCGAQRRECPESQSWPLSVISFAGRGKPAIQFGAVARFYNALAALNLFLVLAVILWVAIVFVNPSSPLNPFAPNIATAMPLAEQRTSVPVTRLFTSTPLPPTATRTPPPTLTETGTPTATCTPM